MLYPRDLSLVFLDFLSRVLDLTILGGLVLSKENSNGAVLEEKATLAGGCFWGVEEIFRKLPGVVDTRVGYTGGSLPSPTYKQVCTGETGHAEAIEIRYKPELISYETLLHYFFRLHDPTTLNRQGNDKGSQYRSAIFYHSDKQREIALSVMNSEEISKRWSKPIVTELSAAGPFYEAEEYHQDYLQKNPQGYNCHYLRD